MLTDVTATNSSTNQSRESGHDLSTAARRRAPLLRRFLNHRNTTYAAVVGTVAGLVGGGAYRAWMQIPNEFKLGPNMMAAPFQIPLFNTVNDVMLTAMNGPQKYMALAAPLLVTALCISLDVSDWTSLKSTIKLHAPEIAKAITPIALGVLMTMTQTHWAPIIGQLVSVGTNPSGRVILAMTLAWSQALCNQAAHKQCAPSVKRVLNIASVGLGVANAIFMFNTATTYHTVREIASSMALTIGTVEVSKYLWKGLPRIIDIATVVDGASQIAKSIGYDTAAFNAVVLTPMCIAGATVIPGALKNTCVASTETHIAFRIIDKVSAIAVPLMLVNMCSGGLLTVLTGAPRGFITAFELMNTMTAHASKARRLVGILQVRSWLNTSNENNRAHYRWEIAGTVAAVYATIIGHDLLSGALWIAHTGCGLMAERHPIERVGTVTRLVGPRRDESLGAKR